MPARTTTSVGALARDLPEYAVTPPVEAVVFAWGELKERGGGATGAPTAKKAPRPKPTLSTPAGAAEDGQLVRCEAGVGRTDSAGAWGQSFYIIQHSLLFPPQGLDSDRDAVLSPKVVEALLGTRLRGREFNRAPLVRGVWVFGGWE